MASCIRVRRVDANSYELSRLSRCYDVAMRSSLSLHALTIGLFLFFAVGCARAEATRDLPKPAIDLPAAKAGETRTAVFAGGCFWCAEAVFEELNGVSDVTSGYAGGTKETATYEKYAQSNHAEVIRVTYDPAKISYATLLQVFFTMTEPTVKDQQGPDKGHQYRNGIFYANEDEKRVAEAYIKQLTDAKVFDQPIVTTLEPLVEFFPAEDYHQDYVKHHPENPYVQQNSVPKLKKLREKFPELLKK
jgi:peptide-methionine (S)-S-oxide reductase